MALQPHICAIVSEYNPFHRGHAYHMEQTRAQGATHIVAILSGNFVQRGEAALLHKWARAEAALLGGADLVLELPLPWAMAGAEIFARGAVQTADALGCVSSLSFGSESGDLASLKQAAALLRSQSFSAQVKRELQTGQTFAAARERAVARLAGEKISSLLQNANDILAVEYLKAIAAEKSPLSPLAVRRIGAGHDGTSPADGFASASSLRALILAGRQAEAEPYLTADSYRILLRELSQGAAPAAMERLERPILARLRTMRREDFACLPDVSEGLEGRIDRAVRTETDLFRLYDKIKTKRYTHARIRRIIVGAFLGLSSSAVPPSVPYLRVLGMNVRGRDILRLARSSARVPILLRAADRASLSPEAESVYRLECRATDLYMLALPKAGPCGLDLTRGPVIPTKLKGSV